ncbi:MAG: phytanoyl-CoA dioxygenase family protein [Bdellovibrionales bacterium]|nr:phytanoyl-CoA dioxygenase family protein [Bdellovibrionales bacterium]
MHLDVQTKFTLGTHITDEQHAFYQKYGFVIFKSAYSMEEVQKIRDGIVEATETITAQGREFINGVPVKYGMNNQGKILPQRTPFMNLLNTKVNEMVSHPRLKPLLEFIPGSRFGLQERDGVVINHYIAGAKSKFKKLGWHTDSIRDLFYFEKVRPMLNVGLHIYPSSLEQGGLRIIPGTHKGGLLSLFFRRGYIFDNAPDPQELIVSVEPGDVTIHDGRMWHRAAGPTVAVKGERKSLYFPILCGPVRKKSSESSVPFYLRFMSGLKPPKPETQEAMSNVNRSA